MFFTLDTTFQQIWDTPEFAGWQHMIDHRRNGMNPEMDAMTVAQFGAQTEWNTGLMLESLNFLYDRCCAGRVFYPLYDSGEIGKALTGLAVFPLEKPSKFVVIVPGGGYGAICSLLDGYAYARRLNAMGYAAFVVCYRVDPHTQPRPQQDLARAVGMILEKAEEFRLDCRDYAVMGFSAGAHLAGSFGTQALGYAAYGLPKPGTMILCYPVITMSDPARHEWSACKFLSETGAQDPALCRFWSLELQAGADYPPTYLWQCEGDPAVSVRNSALMAQALQQHGAAFAYEVFPYTCHGLPTDARAEHGSWLQRAVEFWKTHREEDL